MQFTKVIAILSLAATGLAAPTVEVTKRTEGGTSCDQSQGTLACCVQQPVLTPVSSLSPNIAPALGGILGVIPAILPLIVPTVSVAAQCVALIAQVQACATPNICCLNSGNGNSNSAGLIQLLSNNQIAVCPGITV